MKRIVILCDGTWNNADTRHPTNVVRLGQALAPTGGDGQAQVPIYVEGVGTGRRGVTAVTRAVDRVLGGAMGLGLMENVIEAYRHLVFLHEPGDEVYVFGFSRGAYTARSLVGFIRFTGLLSRSALHHIPEAVERYSQRMILTPERRQFRNAEWRAVHSPWVMTDPKDADVYAEFGADSAVPFDVAFLGVWDTVGALGVPGVFTAQPLFGRRYNFHDTDLSDMVRAARHAVAIDERRRAFRPTLWTNLDNLNAGRPDRPYRQEVFAGDHKAVGGGGDIRKLSALALAWMIEGAAEAGLDFDDLVRERILAEGDPLGPLSADTVPSGGIFAQIMRKLGGPRDPVARLEDVSLPARTRWAAGGYRPEGLSRVEAALQAWKDGQG